MQTKLPIPLKGFAVPATVCLALLGGMLAAAAPTSEVNPFESQANLTAASEIDRLVLGRLEALGIPSAHLCSDAVFVRRAYLDVIGTLPTADEAKAFLADQGPDKRGALIDCLLERDEFADYWTLKWDDLLRVKGVNPINLWPNAAQAYHYWIRSCVKQNVPYDRFVRDMLTAFGSNVRVPPANFYRASASKEPSAIAAAVALTFMGERADNWPKEQLAGLAAFFAQVGYKSTDEWKEEIVFWDHGKANAPTVALLPDGTPVVLPIDRDPRAIFADWLITPRNPWFTRNIANRVWFWLLGRGIIHEADDIRPGNPPANPELLAFLEKELIAAGYDLKHLYRLILKSQTYQLSPIPRSDKPEAVAYFASYRTRPIEAEVLIDALDQISGTGERYTSGITEPNTFIPDYQRAIALCDGSITSPFLELFGRSMRATGMESEHNSNPSADAIRFLLNSTFVRDKIRVARTRLAPAGATPREVAVALYLTVLSREPTNEEMRIIEALPQAGGPEVEAEPIVEDRAPHATNSTAAVAAPSSQVLPRKGPAPGTESRRGRARRTPPRKVAPPRPPPDPIEDLIWILINTDEFLCRH